MAISGSGTSSDPYIVDNWDDLVSLASVSPSKYIKFADSEVKTISNITITSRVSLSYATQIDWNGWTIEQIDITISGGNASSLSTTMSMYMGDKWKNLTVNHLNITDPRVQLGRGCTLYNTYWLDVQVGQLDDTYAFWTNKGKNSSGTAYSPFMMLTIYDSIIYMHSQNYSVIFPNANHYYNCEIYMDYKWTQSTELTDIWAITGTNFTSCYIGGTYDVSAGTGSFRVIENLSNAIWIYTSAIFNIKTIVGSNSTMSYGSSIRLGTGAKVLFVTDNGNNATANASSVYTNRGITKAQLRDPDVLTSKSFPYIADDEFRNPQYNSGESDWRWRQNEYGNTGIPFLPFYKYPIYIPPVIYPIERAERISVYDIYEPQNGYDHNGVALLLPSEVESYKEDKGRWDITLKHPLDPYGKWTYIIGQNCIKVNGQIFRIDETEIYTDANQQYITAHANHISYDLKDAFIGDATFEVSTGNAYLAQLIIESQRLIPTQRPTPYAYSFELQSDITGTLQADIHDATVIGAIFGDDNSFANRYGGQLYRDNFHLSVNQTMENIPATPAFKLRYGTDLTKISYKIDFSNWITELLCVDNFGNEWGISYQGSEWIIHHHKTKRIHFSYALDNPDPMACLMADGWNYWLTCNTPKVSIDVAVANLKNDPKYKDFVDLQNLDVGYTGNVYFEQLGINIDLKIVSIRRNELTGDAIQIVLGNAPNSFVRSPVMSQTIVPNGSVEATQAQTIKDMQTEIETVKLRTMRTWAGIKAYKWSDVKSYKWEEIKNGNADN